MAFTAKDVQKLREKTGCGMMDCKKALSEADGNEEKALLLLREKGLAAAAKKSGRIAAEGTVLTIVDKDKKLGTIIEVNSETDFVSKNDSFKDFVSVCANTVIEKNPGSVEELLQMNATGGSETVDAILKEKILTIGENIKIRRFCRMNGNLVSYMHGEGKIGVMVEFKIDDAKAGDEFASFGKDIAMQIAAANPLYLAKEDIPAEVVEEEKKILRAKAINDGRPENVADKIVAGQIAKFYKENCLLEQDFVKDPAISVAAYVKNTGAALGCEIGINSFIRYEKGEGLEKRSDNFADEVAGMVN